MDGSRFDHLAKSMASSATRRNLVRGAFASLLGGAAVAVHQVDVDAASSRGAGETCRKGTDCVSGACEIASDGRRRCCGQQCYNCGFLNTETCCDPLCNG